MVNQEFEESEIVLCTVDKIVGTIVFVKIEDNGEGTITTSEISPGRIRNLRDYVVPGKKIVCKILSLKNGIHLSLRRVKPSEKKELLDKISKEKSYKAILKTVLETVSRRIKQDNIENIETLWSDLEVFGATKIGNNSLDIALLINTLYQSNSRAPIIRETLRLLKKEGRLVVVEWKNIATPFGPPLSERVNTESLKIGARKLGLELEDEFNAGEYHYGLIFVK